MHDHHRHPVPGLVLVEHEGDEGEDVPDDAQHAAHEEHHAAHPKLPTEKNTQRGFLKSLLWLTHDLSIAVNSSASTEIPMLHCMTVTSCSDAFVESLHPIQFIRNTVTFGNSPVSKFFQIYH